MIRLDRKRALIILGIKRFTALAAFQRRFAGRTQLHGLFPATHRARKVIHASTSLILNYQLVAYIVIKKIRLLFVAPRIYHPLFSFL